MLCPCKFAPVPTTAQYPKDLNSDNILKTSKSLRNCRPFHILAPITLKNHQEFSPFFHGRPNRIFHFSSIFYNLAFSEDGKSIKILYPRSLLNVQPGEQEGVCKGWKKTDMQAGGQAGRQTDRDQCYSYLMGTEKTDNRGADKQSNSELRASET